MNDESGGMNEESELILLIHACACSSRILHSSFIIFRWPQFIRASVHILWFCDQLSLTCLHIRYTASPSAARPLSYRSGHNNQPDWLLATDRVTMLDAAWQKDEASLLQVKALSTTAKGNGSLKHIEHLILGLVGVVRRLLPLSRDVLQEGNTATIP